MSEYAVPADASLLSRLDRLLFRLEYALALGAGLAILTVMLVSVANILGRKLFGLPVPGFVDWMEQAVPLIAFLGVGYCMRLGGHIRMDLAIGQLRGRALYAAEFAGTLLILLLVLVLIAGSWLHFERSFDWGSPLWSRDSTIDIGLPIWPVKLVVPVMLSLLALRLALQLWAFARAVVENPAEAVAVPKIESAAEQAEHEAEAVTGERAARGPGREAAG
jgi:TRAP-type mannitol/chloroaromatic compound transport system permease small subunit